jgi:hypothetical protein
MRTTDLNERPSAFTAGCAHAHAYGGVGRLAVPGVPATRWRLAEQPVAFTNQSQRYQSVQLQDAQTRLQGINGHTAKATGMAQTPIALSSSALGVEASGVPPRGRPV